MVRAPTSAAVTLRRLLPIALALPPILGLSLFWVREHDLVAMAPSILGTTALMTGLFTVTVLWTARALHHAEVEAELARAGLQERVERATRAKSDFLASM